MTATDGGRTRQDQEGRGNGHIPDAPGPDAFLIGPPVAGSQPASKLLEVPPDLDGGSEWKMYMNMDRETALDYLAIEAEDPFLDDGFINSVSLIRGHAISMTAVEGLPRKDYKEALIGFIRGEASKIGRRLDMVRQSFSNEGQES